MRRKMEKNKQEIPRLFQLWDKIMNDSDTAKNEAQKQSKK
jgi:hypothetical protein